MTTQMSGEPLVQRIDPEASILPERMTLVTKDGEEFPVSGKMMRKSLAMCAEVEVGQKCLEWVVGTNTLKLFLDQALKDDHIVYTSPSPKVDKHLYANLKQCTLVAWSNCGTMGIAVCHANNQFELVDIAAYELFADCPISEGLGPTGPGCCPDFELTPTLLEVGFKRQDDGPWHGLKLVPTDAFGSYIEPTDLRGAPKGVPFQTSLAITYRKSTKFCGGFVLTIGSGGQKGFYIAAIGAPLMKGVRAYEFENPDGLKGVDRAEMLRKQFGYPVRFTDGIVGKGGANFPEQASEGEDAIVMLNPHADFLATYDPFPSVQLTYEQATDRFGLLDRVDVPTRQKDTPFYCDVNKFVYQRAEPAMATPVRNPEPNGPDNVAFFNIMMVTLPCIISTVVGDIGRKGSPAVLVVTESPRNPSDFGFDGWVRLYESSQPTKFWYLCKEVPHFIKAKWGDFDKNGNEIHGDKALVPPENGLREATAEEKAEMKRLEDENTKLRENQEQAAKKFADAAEHFESQVETLDSEINEASKTLRTLNTDWRRFVRRVGNKPMQIKDDKDRVEFFAKRDAINEAQTKVSTLQAIKSKLISEQAMEDIESAKDLLDCDFSSASKDQAGPAEK